MPLIAALVATAALVAADPPATSVGLYMERKPTAKEAASNYTAAKFEPRYGCYVGAFIDLDESLTESYKDMVGKTRKLPEPFEKLTGKEHATYFYYMGYGSRLAKDWITKLGSEGKIVHIALEPNNGLEWVKEDDYLVRMAQDLGNIRTPIFLRFASEMNGPWVNYHGDAKLYRQKFRLVSAVMKKWAPNVAMVWCPYATPISPVKSYYPGDDVVDWVGVNLYSVTFFDQNPNKPAKQVHPVDMLDYVYRAYSEKKPIMIGEFGATHFSALEGKSTTDFARRSIASLYAALPRKYPRVKCIDYFNGNNLVLDHAKNNNYAVTQNPDVLATYKAAIAPSYFLSHVVNADGYADPQPFAVPVSGEGSPTSTMVPEVPMPLKDGQTISGVVMLSGWTKDFGAGVKLRFKVDGKTFYVGDLKDGWEVELDTARLDPGMHTFELSSERNGERLSSKSLKLNVVE